MEVVWFGDWKGRWNKTGSNFADLVTKETAKSKTILGVLCNILLKLVHNDFGFPSLSDTIFEN